MNNVKEKTILSIDPGYERLGICVLRKNLITKKINIIHSECFKTSKDQDFQDRLFCIGTYIEDIIKKHQPSDIAIESLFMNTNQKTALKVSEVKGVLIYISKKSGLKVYEYTPLQIKSAVTGSGRSDKTAVQKMLYLLIPELKNMTKKIDDEYDAIACGLTHFAFERGIWFNINNMSKKILQQEKPIEEINIKTEDISVGDIPVDLGDDDLLITTEETLTVIIEDDEGLLEDEEFLLGINNKNKKKKSDDGENDDDAEDFDSYFFKEE